MAVFPFFDFIVMVLEVREMTCPCAVRFSAYFLLEIHLQPQNMYTACVSTGKLTFVNDTDLIAGDHAAFTFQGGIGNIKYIGGTVRVQNKLAS